MSVKPHALKSLQVSVRGQGQAGDGQEELGHVGHLWHQMCTLGLGDVIPNPPISGEPE